MALGKLGDIRVVGRIDARVAEKPLERFWRFERPRKTGDALAGFSSFASQPLHAATNCAEAGRRAPSAFAVVEVANPSSLARSATSSFRRLCSARTRSRKTSHSDASAADADTFTVFAGAAAVVRFATGGCDSSSTSRWITFRSGRQCRLGQHLHHSEQRWRSLCMTRHSSHRRQHAESGSQPSRNRAIAAYTTPPWDGRPRNSNRCLHRPQHGWDRHRTASA
jgi:hypothetical protein